MKIHVAKMPIWSFTEQATMNSLRPHLIPPHEGHILDCRSRLPTLISFMLSPIPMCPLFVFLFYHFVDIWVIAIYVIARTCQTKELGAESFG